jgi:hypothetical protein
MSCSDDLIQFTSEITTLDLLSVALYLISGTCGLLSAVLTPLLMIRPHGFNRYGGESEGWQLLGLK